MTEFPGIKFVELGKVLGERWRALTPTDKKGFEEMAGQDKVRFQLEMQQYTANQALPVVQPPPPPPVAAVNAAADHYYAQDPAAAAAVAAASIGYHDYGVHDAVHHDPYGQHHYQA